MATSVSLKRDAQASRPGALDLRVDVFVTTIRSIVKTGAARGPWRGRPIAEDRGTWSRL